MSCPYKVNIGLEIHTELSTQSKAFCGCKNQFGAIPNTLCCPVCAGFPGTLPMLNKSVVDYALMLGQALDCTINTTSFFDRKQYFYPDMPKAYQITQYYRPICENGALRFHLHGGLQTIGIERIHIEEDSGKLIHSKEYNETYADYNRSGVPLLEIVTKPDLSSPEEAKAALIQIARILRYLHISDAKMQEGSLRADVNLSLRRKDTEILGAHTETKNINSFSAVERAAKFEMERQIRLLEQGDAIAQETRKWDDSSGQSQRLRDKGETVDYRYFPEPDLPPLVVSPDTVRQAKEKTPALPIDRMLRFMNHFGLDEYSADLLSATKAKADFFEKAMESGFADAKSVCNWILGDIAKYLNENKLEIDQTQLDPPQLVHLCALVQNGALSNTAAKSVLAEMLCSGGVPEEIMAQKGLVQNNNADELERAVLDVLAQHAKAVEDYKKGKTNVIGFLVGQVMKQTKGSANPSMVKEIVLGKLNNLN